MPFELFVCTRYQQYHAVPCFLTSALQNSWVTDVNLSSGPNYAVVTACPQTSECCQVWTVYCWQFGPFSVESKGQQGVSKNMGNPPNHPLKNRVFPYFHHPFGGFYPYFLEIPNWKVTSLAEVQQEITAFPRLPPTSRRVRFGLESSTEVSTCPTFIYLGWSPLPVRVTTRIVTFLVGNPYKPSFPLLLGGGTTQPIP